MFIEKINEIRDITNMKESTNYLHSVLNYSYDDIITEYQREVDYHTTTIEKLSNTLKYEDATSKLIKRMQKKVDKFENGDKNITYEEYINAKEVVNRLSSQLIDVKNKNKSQIKNAEIELKKYSKELARIKGIIYQLKSQEEEQARKEHLEEQISTRNNSVFVVYGD